MTEILDTILDVATAVILAVAIVVGAVNFIKGKRMDKLEDPLVKYIVEAEKKYPDASQGELKKEYVLSKIQTDCKNNKIPYKLVKDVLDSTIDCVIKHYNAIAKNKEGNNNAC